MKRKLKVPKFKNEEEEFRFWSSFDPLSYFDPSDFKSFDLDSFLTSKSKPRNKRITIRLPEGLIAKVKTKARELDVPYQSLMKQYIQKGARV